MVLAIEELSALEDEIMSVLPDRITAILSKLNRSGRLEELLELLGMEDLLKQEQDFYSYKEGKIVVVGGTDVKEEVLLSIAKNLGIDKSRFEFCLDYKQIQKFDFRRMQYAPQYRNSIKLRNLNTIIDIILMNKELVSFLSLWRQ